MRSLSTSSLAVVRAHEREFAALGEDDEVFARLSQYAAAVEAQARGNFEEARQRYLKAVELDPDFGLGYQGLAAMS